MRRVQFIGLFNMKNIGFVLLPLSLAMVCHGAKSESKISEPIQFKSDGMLRVLNVQRIVVGGGNSRGYMLGIYFDFDKKDVSRLLFSVKGEINIYERKSGALAFHKTIEKEENMSVDYFFEAGKARLGRFFYFDLPLSQEYVIVPSIQSTSARLSDYTIYVKERKFVK